MVALQATKCGTGGAALIATDFSGNAKFEFVHHFCFGSVLNQHLNQCLLFHQKNKIYMICKYLVEVSPSPSSFESIGEATDYPPIVCIYLFI